MSEAMRCMFDRVARRYDLGNALLTFGLHGQWKRALVARGSEGGTRPGPLRPGASAVDVACGTGDVALLLARIVGGSGRVLGVDFSAAMLAVARDRLARVESNWLEVPGEAEAAASRVRFIEADALALPCADGEFDAATCAFGVRNLDDPLRGLREMARVVRPGGAVLILETGVPSNALSRALYRRYISVLTTIVGAATGSLAAYRYLQQSAERFPCGAEFERVMGSTSAFSRVEAWPLIGGAAWIYRGSVAERQP